MKHVLLAIPVSALLLAVFAVFGGDGGAGAEDSADDPASTEAREAARASGFEYREVVPQALVVDPPATAGLGRIRGVVQDERDRPVVAACVSLRRRAGSVPAPWRGRTTPILRRAWTDDDGRFELGDLGLGVHVAEVEVGETRSARRVVLLSGEERERSLRLQLAATPRRVGFRVRTVDVTGQPVPGVQVRVHGLFEERDEGLSAREYGFGGRSDSRGEWFCPRLDLRCLAATVVARDDDRNRGLARYQSGEDVVHGVALQLAAPAQFVGRPLFPMGNEVGSPPLLFVLKQRLGTTRHAVAIASALTTQGRFSITDLPAGDYWLELIDRSGLCLLRRKFWLEQEPRSGWTPANAAGLSIRAESGAQIVRTVDIGEGGRIRGRVTHDSKPVPEAIVRVWELPPRRRGLTVPDRPLAALPPSTATRLLISGPEACAMEMRTREDGTYRFVGLAPGHYRVEVHAPGLGYERRGAVAVQSQWRAWPSSPSRMPLEHRLRRTGELHGRVHGRALLRLEELARGPGVHHPVRTLQTQEDGTFVFPAVAEGDYAITLVSHSPFGMRPAEGLPAELLRFRIRAAESLWLDLRREELRWLPAPEPERASRGRFIAIADPIVERSEPRGPIRSVSASRGPSLRSVAERRESFVSVDPRRGQLRFVPEPEAGAAFEVRRLPVPIGKVRFVVVRRGKPVPGARVTVQAFAGPRAPFGELSRWERRYRKVVRRGFTNALGELALGPFPGGSLRARVWLQHSPGVTLAVVRWRRLAYGQGITWIIDVTPG